MRPSLTGGVGYVDNTVRPEMYRQQGYESGPRLLNSSGQPVENPAPPAASQSANPPPDSTSQKEPEPAFAQATPGPIQSETQAQEDQGWWSPGMEMAPMSYDYNQEGTYSYGGPSFYQQ